jgi:hypothetical protein
MGQKETLFYQLAVFVLFTCKTDEIMRTFVQTRIVGHGCKIYDMMLRMYDELSFDCAYHMHIVSKCPLCHCQSYYDATFAATDVAWCSSSTARPMIHSQ